MANSAVGLDLLAERGRDSGHTPFPLYIRALSENLLLEIACGSVHACGCAEDQLKGLRVRWKPCGDPGLLGHTQRRSKRGPWAHPAPNEIRRFERKCRHRPAPWQLDQCAPVLVTRGRLRARPGEQRAVDIGFRL